MADVENVKKGIYEMLIRCSWDDIDKERHRFQPVLNDVLELLKEHKEHEELLTKLGYHWTGNGETLALCKKSKAGEQE